jgi:hypothetical protein
MQHLLGSRKNQESSVEDLKFKDDEVYQDSAASRCSPLSRDPFCVVWGDRSFLKSWTGQSLSLFGSQITMIALPLIAFLVFITFHGKPSKINKIGSRLFNHLTKRLLTSVLCSSTTFF